MGNDGCARAFGLLWLALAIGFIVTGTALAAGRPDFIWIARLAVVSLVLCIVAWPDTRIGLRVNAAILAATAVRH